MRTMIDGASIIKNGSIYKEDLNTQAPGAAIITSISVGEGLSLEHTGVDIGTGDVVITSTGPVASIGLSLSGDQSIQSYTLTKVRFDVLDWNTGSTYNTTNFRYTASKDGIHQIILSAYLKVSAIGYIQVYKNGSLLQTLCEHSAKNIQYIGVANIDLHETDYLEMWVYLRTTTKLNSALTITRG